METLTDVIQDAARKRAVVADAAVAIDQEVAGKGGLSGLAIKAGYKTVKTMRPGMIEETLHFLLPDFTPILDPFYAKARESGDVKAYFTKNAETIADALLGVTDRKRERSKNAVIRRAYDGLRPQAKKHVAEAMPRVADLVQRHVR